MSDDSTDSDSFHSCDDDNSECETKSELSVAERRKLIEEAQSIKEPEPNLSSDEAEPQSPSPSAQIGNFGGFFSSIVNGGLDVLETLGKKTFETLTVKDEGDDRRRFLYDLSNKSTNLSDILREVRAQHGSDPSETKTFSPLGYGSANLEKTNTNFVILFEKAEGMVHLEGLELLSTNYKSQNQPRNSIQSGTFDEQVANFCVEDVSECPTEDFIYELKKCVLGIGLPYKADNVLKMDEELREQLEGKQEYVDAGNDIVVEELHEAAIISFAKLTAHSIQALHKIAQLIGIADDLPNVDFLFAFTYVLCRRLSFYASQYSNLLSLADPSKEVEDMNQTTNFVTAVAWVPRGVAAKNPQTVKLEHTTIKELIESNAADEETSDTDVQEESEQKGLRGSAPKSDVNMSEDPQDKFNMKGYDEEESSGPTMKGIAVFSKPEDDPYIATTKDDSEDEAERDAMQIKPNDNLAVVAKFDGEDTTLIVYVYNSENGDFYIRQDYPIQAPILCLEHICYDPGAEDKRGNLIAIGTMNPDIEIHDLDILNSVKPIGKLGSSSKEARKKRDGSDQCHKDSVLSLSWNKEVDHLLASGGADQIVVLWDLDEAKPAQNLSIFDGMVQTLEWQPKQASILLSGTRAGTCRLDDCRTDEAVANWNFSDGAEIEVEKLLWDRQHEHNAYILTSDGKLRYIDTRKSGQVITTIQAHEDEEIGGISLSSINGFLTTIGGEQAKFWKNTNGQIELVASKKFHMGKLRACSFNPDLSNILLLGGEKEDLIHIYDVAKLDSVATTFTDLKPSATVDELDKDEDVEMNEG